jgi:integrase
MYAPNQADTPILLTRGLLMPLTATAAKQAKAKAKPYKLSDEKGMFLLVNPNETKYWRLKYRHGGKEKTLALGVYPEVSLKDARLKRDEARQQLSKNIDPINAKRSLKAATQSAATSSMEAVSLEWFDNKMVDKTVNHSNRVKRRLEKDLFPYLGTRPINEITPPELLSVLRKIEQRGAIETAHRVKQIAGQVFRYAIATGRAERDPSADLKGALANPVKGHFSAITTPKEAGKLMLAIESFQGTPVVKAALQLAPLFFVRPGELRHMEWSEINFDDQQWEIPASKMKMKEPHIVPLCRQAVNVITELQPLTSNSRYVLPNARSNSRALSENGVRTALRTMGYDNDTMTSHGFRAMARTILDEVLEYPIEWIEQQLAHAVKDANGRSYNRTKHLTQRRKMLQHWADYLDNLKEEARSPNVITASFTKNTRKNH